MRKRKKLPRAAYEKSLSEIYVELVKWQYWIKQNGLRVMIVFEGRDAAGKGGTIKRLMEPLNPRGCNVIALPAPSDREKTCLLYPSDAADERSSVDLGGRRNIKKKKKQLNQYHTDTAHTYL